MRPSVLDEYQLILKPFVFLIYFDGFSLLHTLHLKHTRKMASVFSYGYKFFDLETA